MKFTQILTLIIALLILTHCAEEKKEQEIKEITIPVALERVALKPFEVSYHSIGRLVSENQVNLLFQTAGQVDSIWVQVGDSVHKDQALASINTDVYQPVYTQAKSMYEKAQRDLTSSQSLLKSNVISSDQYEMARLGLDNARAAYTQAKNSLDNAVLKAPFDGWVVTRNLNVGDLVSPAGAMQPPFIIADMQNLKVTIPVPEARIGQIREGQKARVEFKTFPDRTFSGEVIRVGLAPKGFSNNFDVEIKLTGDLNDLKLGIIADVYIIQESYAEALVFPLNLIQDDGAGKFVYLAENGRATKRAIQVETITGSEVLVKANISTEDTLIVRGHQDVIPGSLLDVVE